MKFQNVLKMEVYKVFKKNSALLLLIFCTLPIFYGIGNMRNSQAVTIEGCFSAITFGSMCWSLLGLTGVSNVIFTVLVINYFGKEKEAGQLKLLVLNVCDKKKTIWAKYTVILTFRYFKWVIYNIGTCIVCPLFI